MSTRKGTSSELLYTKGTRVWIPDKENVWQSAEIQKDYKQTDKELLLQTEDGKDLSIPIKSIENLPHLRNPDILIGQNDLTSLSYLHEPAVLYNLKHRFLNNNIIYTYCGIVLVAINPYEELEIYNAETVWAYRGQAMGDLDPHIFAVAEEAYTKMERDSRDQSIIVSGESGAGKTVSAKYAMRYFATVGGSENETQIEKKVLASSPIMEAIGNAKTTRNDNSSRFGKYVELHFDKKYSIMGASMRTYLLEKSRVVFQSDDERNYHIFYQICSTEHQEVSDLYLAPADSFLYTNQGDASVIKGISDSETFLETLEALTLLGFGIDKRRNFFKVLAGILHLGNVQIHGSEDESCSIRKDDKHLTHLCELLSLDFDSMRKWLCHRRIVSGKEEFIKAMTQAEAKNCRDALSKLLYAQVFNWIVEGINESLKTSGKWNRFIGVLDIYGFETFEFNSFEQFCINYANEKLQQQFNQHVFKLEQEEYVREGIEWTFIEFYDNQPCIDLIETKLGILDLLDEECRMPNGSDSSWTLKLYNKCGKWADHFSKPRMNENGFNIHHFADKVEYQSVGFLEKNRDTVLQEQIFTLAESKNSFVSSILNDSSELPAKGHKSKVAVTSASAASATATRKKTVGSQFRDSLTLLMTSLNATTPHYVRCIKPNDVKSSFQFDSARAVQQLRACGVLETIRISAAGFPSRWTYSDFFSRYRVLCHSRDVKKDMQSNCERIVTRIIEDPENYRFGKTKIFFRAGQVAYMEKIRLEKLRRCGLIIQKNIRSWFYFSRYRKLKKATLAIQTYGRGMLARKRALHMRQTAAAIKIQKHFRRFVAQRKFQQLRRLAVGLQAIGRGYIARQRASYLLKVQNVQKIQRYWRGCLARRKRDKMVRNIVLVQCCVRRWLARRRFRALKIEARSLDHVRQLNRGLENKIIELQQKIGDLMKEINQNKHLKSEQAHLKTEREANKALEAQLKALQLKIVEAEKSKNVAELNLKKEVDEKVDLVTAKTRLESDFVQLTGEKDKLAAKLAEALEQISKLEKRNEKLEIIRLEKSELEKEMDEQTIQYQTMLKKMNDLEQQLHLQQKNPVPLPRKTAAPSSATPSVNSLDSSGVESFQEDVGLILALQQRLKDSEEEKERLIRMVELKENESPASEKRRAHDSLRLQELEMENAKLTDNLKALRQSIENKNGTTELQKQFEQLQEELSRKKEESIQLRSVLASKQPNQQVLSGDDENEIGLILQTQKTVIQQLEKELQDEKNSKTSMEQALRSEITKLKEELATVFTHLKSPQNKNELLLQHQIQRLTTENLNLRAKNEDLKHQLHKIPAAALEHIDNSPAAGPMIHKMKRNYTGMLQYQDEVKLTKILIIDLKPKIAMSALPGLPAYIIFMCIRYTDNINDDEKVSKLLTCVIQNVKKVINKRGTTDFEVSVLWLGNVLRLLHTLKQYSGDPSFQRQNTSIQNEQALKNFDLSEYRQVLSDVAVWIYIMVIKHLEDRIQPLIVPAILETDTGIASHAIGVGAGHRSSRASISALQKPLEMLTGELDSMHAQLCSFGVDPEVISQVLRQLYYYLCAGALNNLLLRRDLCNWAKGIQIRYNVSVLEEWSRNKKLGSKEVLQTLNPIIQASQLLQARKSDSDVASISEMCDTLTIPQVVKLLNLYTTDEYENKLTPAFIAKVKAHLTSTRKEEDTTNVLMDTKYSFAVKFPFNPSSIRLEDLEVPESFGLSGIVKRV